MKNGKSCGEDEILSSLNTDQYHQIAVILNNSYNGEYPTELTTGLLATMQKPGKQKSQPENIRPIILLCLQKNSYNYFAEKNLAKTRTHAH